METSLRSNRSPLARADAFQRKNRLGGLVVGVAYKFFDDQGSYLAAAMTFYAFNAIFPLLLIASSVLGFVLHGDPHLKTEVLNSALSQFPIVGSQLGQPAGIEGSGTAIVIGVLAALYGTNGLGQAAQNAVNVTLAVPRNERVNPILARLRSLVILFVGGLTVLALAVITSLASHAGVVGISGSGAVQWLLRIASAVLTAGVLAVMVSYASSGRQSAVQTLPGSALIAVLWQALQSLGGTYVQHVLTKVSAMNSTFGLVLGLLAFLYLAALIAVLGLELNVVLADRLYPRSLATPFTDRVRLTEADRRAYAAYAKAQRFKGFERIEVEFEPDKQQLPAEQEGQRG